MSTKNPFRTPVASPNPTGSGSATPPQQLPVPYPSLPRISSVPTSYASPPGPPPDHQPSSGSPDNNAGPSQSNSNVIETNDLNAEAPPAYTPSADPYQGESTLEVGPRRPFQPPPRPSPHQHRQHNHTSANQSPQSSWLSPPQSGYGYGFNQSNPNIHQQPSDSADWSAYPGQQHRLPQQYAPPPVPPPRHTSLSHSRSQPDISSTPATVQSEFARDFYAAGSGDDRITPPVSPENTSRNQYAPPLGPPPGPSGNASTSAREARKDIGGIPDDGSPTKIPTPGHPLLLNNKLLVYPGGYECHKCNNTGFKNFDPTHPCRKCWDRYAKPYAGAITYTPWSNQSNGPSSSRANNNFQRPLPSFRPPHLARSTTHAHNRAISNPDSHLSYARTSASPSSSPLRQYPHPAIPPPQIHVTSPYSAPPPGSTVVQPGDPRIGGRLCYKCSGSGVVPFMLFEETTCAVCGGVGRIF